MIETHHGIPSWRHLRYTLYSTWDVNCHASIDHNMRIADWWWSLVLGKLNSSKMTHSLYFMHVTLNNMYGKSSSAPNDEVSQPSSLGLIPFTSSIDKLEWHLLP
jgi:hypothetical protein